MSQTKNALFVVDGVRTPFVLHNQELADIGADELGRFVARTILNRYPDLQDKIDEVIFGCVGPEARVANIARVIALRAGVRKSIPAVTVQRNCASGMESLAQVFHRADRGPDSVFLVGGTESMSNYPFYFSKEMKELMSRLGRAKTLPAKVGEMLRFRPRYLKPRIALLEGLTDPVCGLSMGRTAENLARYFEVTRQEQDEFAVLSHQRAHQAQEKLRQETMLVVTDSGSIRDDSSVRPQQDQEALRRLRPVFARQYGTITPGNACAVTDGAVAMLVAEEGALQGQEPLGVVRDAVNVGLAPERMGLGPAFAIAKILERNQLTLDDIDLFEINEAFAAQVLACLKAMASTEFCKRELKLKKALGRIEHERLNVNGGAIALGHPVGASGARLVLTLLKELKRSGKKRGIAALCVGGGQGSAVLVERE